MHVKIKLFYHMYRIRAVEEKIAQLYPQGQMRCPVHLSIGQESIPAVFAECVRPTDFAVSTHRGHAHYLAKGGNLNAMIAEIYGKATGCAKGKGGSMHLVDLGVNFIGTSAIVGNSIPIGVGLALSSQLKGTDQVSCVFLGDGAVEEGVFYESVNFAVVRNLSVLFICENNLYSVYSPLAVRQPKGRSIADMVAAMGIVTASSDGADLVQTGQIMQEAFDRIRGGNGPQFLEFSTYRWREHCGHDFDNHLGYRTEEEFQYWLGRDPLESLTKNLQQDSHDVRQQMEAIKIKVDAEISEAFESAAMAPFPARAEAFEGVYA
ncbi:MAG: thiamine pyrophosphate-dependent dehydrogenase E1 component subunit alpha [Magnetococcales bacterium]|nr:thiamine pyrophosphate-dependent dehydrogenase E1 component subunit alpha [Magnetococcales bacterium]